MPPGKAFGRNYLSFEIAKRGKGFLLWCKIPKRETYCFSSRPPSFRSYQLKSNADALGTDANEG